MSCIHITACQLASSPPAFPVLSFQHSKASICPSFYLGTKFPKVFFKLTSATSRYQQAPVVCLFDGKGKSENGNEQGSPWKAIENAVGNFKKNRSIEDVLKQQIEKQEYYDDGGMGGKPPGGGGGGGGGDGFGEAEDEPGTWDEFVQVILATTGFIFLYIFILEGEEMTVIARDLIRFLLTRQKSIRLNRLIEQWTSFVETMKEKEEFDPYWLEREIISTTTWYDSPAKYNYIIKVLNSTSHHDHDHDDNDNDDYE